jgi:hypothetical protein
VASRPHRRTNRPVLPRSRARAHRLRPARPGQGAVRRMGCHRQGRTAGLGLPRPASARRPAAPPGHDDGRHARPARRPVRVTGLELRDQRRTPARARDRGAQRDDRRHGGPSAAVER